MFTFIVDSYFFFDNFLATFTVVALAGAAAFPFCVEPFWEVPFLKAFSQFEEYWLLDPLCKIVMTLVLSIVCMPVRATATLETTYLWSIPAQIVKTAEPEAGRNVGSAIPAFLRGAGTVLVLSIAVLVPVLECVPYEWANSLKTAASTRYGDEDRFAEYEHEEGCKYSKPFA